jgi:hypothetical protein
MKIYVELKGTRDHHGDRTDELRKEKGVEAILFHYKMTVLKVKA